MIRIFIAFDYEEVTLYIYYALLGYSSEDNTPMTSFFDAILLSVILLHIEFVFDVL